MVSKDFTYGGKYYNTVVETVQKYFSSLIDQIEYILPNCTVLVYVLAKINGLPYPANTLPNANRLHTVANNGWEAIKYTSGMTLLPNDIVEWGVNHVAYVIEQGTNPQLYASWWTNYNGTSSGRRKDSQLTNTLKDTVEYLFSRYEFRYFHQTNFIDECNRGGGKANPTYIIRHKQINPTVKSVDRDETKDQIYVSTYEQNMRDEPNGQIVGVSEKGYYNVLETKKSNYDWYKVQSKVWVAKVEGRVEFLPKKETKEYEDLYYEAIEKLTIAEDKLNKIKEIVE